MYKRQVEEWRLREGVGARINGPLQTLRYEWSASRDRDPIGLIDVIRTAPHPVYLDIISSNFAMLIENANSIRETEECKSQMISAYCRFVRKNRLDQYSPLVRKAVTYIRIHLADQLTLAGIAKGIRVSPSYLSRLFNRETGDSVSNFITKARVEKAAGLLSFSGMSIQNIAFYVGFGDLNYFSRCFKKYKKMTPTEYRASSSIGV